MNRRCVLAGGAALIVSRAARAAATPGPLCLFSKHLPGLEPRRMAEALKGIGFGGVDLTVRAGGHIAPERAEADLPAAVAAIRAVGLDVPHITSGLTSGRDPLALPVLRAAARARVPLFRVAHIDYRSDDIPAEVARVGADLRSLAQVARAQGVQMLYQNHVGKFGAPLWDLARALEPLDARWAGVEFDVRHAVAEGGATAWRTGFQLLAPRIRMICVKDFYWRKGPKGWEIQNCPLGEGMVDFRTYFGLLARRGWRGPVSVHIEYLENGDQPGSEARVLAAAERDLAFLRARIGEAYA